MPCKWWWGGTLRLEKSILPFSIMKNISIFFSFNISEFSHIIWNYISIYVKKKKRWKKWTRVFCVFDLLFFFCFFFANERYKHINLLNIFISATLFCFWVHATVSFFSSFRRCRWELRSSMCRGESLIVFWVLVRNPQWAKKEGGNHPLVKPRRGGQVTWFKVTPLCPSLYQCPVPNDISSDITTLWLLHVKTLYGPPRKALSYNTACERYKLGFFFSFIYFFITR